ncbi:hypothetical protein JAAARDRAFT_28003 [Jaapia argillacea MUCL 33604]|uniref:Short-chain dehydrogenase/reductase 3 n=1 Tax=Jaapia argillacea MUCL 33604 TaxID=933084 RepID=A0A067QP14_9AGAM|nr:hypothetical protein JAAARDRAFT_28003 [Jaapia argillacea MUCL 33604]
MARESYEPSPIFDHFDADLVIKVLAHTLFSPFFLSFIPIFYLFQGYDVYGKIIVSSTAYVVAVSLFWGVKWYSRLYRNQASLFYGPPPLDWSEQIVVVTGGSSGIGELLANTLAVKNVTVVVLDVKPIVTENYNITYYKCDISKWEEVEAVSKKVVEELGHPTILINNAGVVQGKLLLDLTPEDVKQTFNVNLLGQFWTLKAFLPEMIKRNCGHIVTMSSVMGMVGAAQMTDYNASKAALVSLHDSLRYELDKRYKAPSVRTTLLLAGHTHTPLFSKAHIPRTWIYNFLVPSLPPVEVVKSVIRALDEQHSFVIKIPFYVHLVPIARELPSFARDFLQWLSGADWAMEGFVKVSGRRDEEGPVPKEALSRAKVD